MIVAKTDRIPMECVVRGYLAGSAWVEYKNAGAVNNIRLSAKLPYGMSVILAIPLQSTSFYQMLVW